MNSLALILTLVVPVQDGTTARRIHPADALFFTEVPDVPGLLAAYEKAPLLQMVGDGDVQAAVQGILESADFPIGSAVTDALSSLGLPSDMAAAPLATARGLLDQVTSTSFSISLSGEHEAVRESLEKLTVCLIELQALEKWVAEYTEEHDGYPPSELSDLELPDDLTRDPWGNPYSLEVDLSSFEPTIATLGEDGAVGGEGFDADFRAGAWQTEQAEQLLAHLMSLVAHVEFREPSQAAAAWAQVMTLAERGGWQANEPRDLKLGAERGRICTLRDANLASRQVWLLEIDRSLTLGYGNDSLERVLERRRAETADLSPDSMISSLASHLDESSGSTVVQGWVQLGPLIELGDGIQAAFESRGTNSAIFHPFPDQTVYRMQLRDDRFVTELASTSKPSASTATSSTAMAADESAGWNRLMDCVGGEPVPDSMWDFVPSESIGVFATSINGRLLYEEVLRTMGASPEKKPRMLSELEQRYGFDLEKDVFGSLGNGAAGYMLPITGVITVPAVALVVELEDSDSFQRGLDGLLNLLNDQAGGEFTIHYKPYRKQPMWRFSFDGSRPMMGPISLSPSLAIVDDHLLVTVTSARAKKEIKRALAGEGERHPFLSNASAPPADAATIGYLDWPSLVDGTYEGARAALSLFGGMAGELPFDPESLPDAATFTRFYEPTILWSRTEAAGEPGDAGGGRGGGGIKHTRLESSFGPETLLGAIGGGGALLLGARAGAVHEIEAEVHGEEVIIEHRRLYGELDREPEESSTIDPEQAKLERATNNSMNGLATRLEVYRIESGRYPVSLTKLLEPTPTYPKGFLPEGVVPADGWGQDFVYAVADDGASFRLWSPGANGIDDQGTLDDVVLQ